MYISFKEKKSFVYVSKQQSRFENKETFVKHQFSFV